MKKLHKDRLLKLAQHLESGKLGHRIFDMRHWNEGPYDKKGCGTAGCAIGECPLVFPKEWIFKKGQTGYYYYYPRLREGFSTTESIRKFFGFKNDEECALFVWTHQYTARQQAKRIRDFVKRKK